jgi:hypothetical protein
MGYGRRWAVKMLGVLVLCLLYGREGKIVKA